MDTHTYQVLHSRPPLEVKAPKTITALAFLVNDQENNSRDSVELEFIEDLITKVYGHYEEPLPMQSQGRLYERFECQQTITTERNGKVICVLQKHTSFFYIAFFSDRMNEEGKLLWGAISPAQHHDLFKKAVFKTHIRVEKADPNEKDYSYMLEETFNSCLSDANKSGISNIYTELFGSIVSDEGAVVWTPFRCFHDGFNRILIRDISLRPARLGRLVRRLVEIDMYVTLGGRNFHIAQKQLKEFIRHEQTLKNIIESEGSQNGIADRQLFENLTLTSKKVSRLVAETRYDFQATVAYSELVWQRILELREQRLEGWTRIGYFLERTFRPCVRTCESALRYQLAVSQGIEEAASLLGARLSLKAQEDAGEIIAQQHKGEKEQRSLRTTVELVALIPIAYYLAHIFAKWFGETELLWWIVVPLVWICISWLIFSDKGREKLENLTRKSAKKVAEQEEPREGV